jgi:hypothetical protein
MDLHARYRFADAGGGQDAFALDFDHAGAAVTVGPVPWLGGVAEVRNQGAEALRDLPERFARKRGNVLAVELKRYP